MNPPDWSGFDLHDIDTTGISDADLALDREPIARVPVRSGIGEVS
jgi:hypothetical protein